MFYFLNKNVKYLRKRKNLTHQQLADILKIQKSSLANFESGSRNCSLEVLVDLSKFFNITIDELIFKDLSLEQLSK